MAREPQKVDLDERKRIREEESLRLMKQTPELQDFINEGNKHTYAFANAEFDEKRAGAIAHPKENSEEKKPSIPRKDPSQIFVKKQIRMPPAMIKAIEEYASTDGKEFSEAVRSLISQGLRVHLI